MKPSRAYHPLMTLRKNAWITVLILKNLLKTQSHKGILFVYTMSTFVLLSNRWKVIIQPKES